MYMYMKKFFSYRITEELESLLNVLQKYTLELVSQALTCLSIPIQQCSRYAILEGYCTPLLLVMCPSVG